MHHYSKILGFVVVIVVFCFVIIIVVFAVVVVIVVVVIIVLPLFRAQYAKGVAPQGHKRLGRTLLKHRILNLMGWHVINIPFWEFGDYNHRVCHNNSTK